MIKQGLDPSNEEDLHGYLNKLPLIWRSPPVAADKFRETSIIAAGT